MTKTADPAVQTLTDDECWRLLTTTDFGRMGVALDGGVDIFPINFLVSDHHVYFRSAPGSKMIEITHNPFVAFEADGISHRERWSVVVRGRATRLNSDVEIEESGVQRLHTVSPTDKWNYVRIDPSVVSGSRFPSARRAK